jgi:hypothetical protein
MEIDENRSIASEIFLALTREWLGEPKKRKTKQKKVCIFVLMPVKMCVVVLAVDFIRTSHEVSLRSHRLSFSSSVSHF